MDAISQFRLALAARQIIPPVEIIADGNIHRCDAEGKNGRGDAAYLLRLDEIPAGGLQNHRDGRGWENWRAEVGRLLSPAEDKAVRARNQAQRVQRERDAVVRHTKAKDRARAIWDDLSLDAFDHPYLALKGVKSHETRLFTKEMAIAGMDCNGALVVPMRSADGDVRHLPPAAAQLPPPVAGVKIPHPDAVNRRRSAPS